MKKSNSYHNNNYGRKVEKFVVPTLAETINLFDKLRRSGQVFRADFIKRTTGEWRTMVCRCGVKKYLKGGKAAYNFGDKGLLSVFEFGKGYRSITLDNLACIKTGGVIYWFNVPLDPGTYSTEIFDDITEGARTLPAYTTPLKPAPSEEFAV